MNAPATGSLVSVLRGHSQAKPDLVLYRFLGKGESETERLTCFDLDRRARAIAARLQAAGHPGDRALLLFPPGLEFIAAFMGCLYAGVAAVPAYPPNPNQSLSRLQGIASDAAARFLLTTAAQLDGLAGSVSSIPALAAADWVATDAVAEAAADDWRDPGITDETAAFLQYTSGSTEAPRGVVISHGNLLCNERIIRAAFEHDETSIVAGWLPLYHDMGLIGNVLQPLFLGIPCILMSPLAFLQRPVRWLRAISDYRATTSGAPNFAYDLCVQRIRDEQCEGLDLSSWDLAYNGSEPVRAGTLERFSQRFAPYGFRREAFYPCYGLAENTLFATGGSKAAAATVRRADPADASEAALLVGCGHGWEDTRLLIVDPKTCVACPPGATGEVWIAGGSVARGYWNRPEVSARMFQARLADTGDGPFLRTGDLGFVDDGELFITGRLKEVIIIRGRNYYPQDIELTVEKCHPALRPHSGAAFSVTVGAEERLVVVQEVERKTLRSEDIDEVAGNIVEAVAQEHGLTVYDTVLLPPGTIPKTSSGKIQRKASRAVYLVGAFQSLSDEEESPWQNH